jgi:AcrR family transcriptional regulator
MRKRAEDVEATRRRITEAAVELHTSVGPAHTSISALAEKAGVTRLTVYRHFPDEESLFLACSAHWFGLHPPPDASRWRTISDPRDRARCAIGEQYDWYDRNGDEFLPLVRDIGAAPAALVEASREADAQRALELLVGVRIAGGARRRLAAVAGHVLDFWTWHSLVVRQGVSTGEAVAIAVRFFTTCLDGAKAGGKPASVTP